jgi:hypothetical protein
MLGTLRRRLRISIPMLALYLALASLFLASIFVWVLERNTSWANNWLPNFIAEWSGILITALVVERLVQAQARREAEAFYRPLRHTAGLAIGRALRPMIDFLLAVAESTGLKTRPAYDLVSFFEELWHWLVVPRSGIVDPRACLAAWADTLEEVEARLRDVHARYDTILDPGAIVQIDKLADCLGERQWLVNEVGRPIEADVVTNLITPHLYQATSPVAYLSGYFEEMVGTPLMTGPWHVAPEEQRSWRTLSEAWERTREDARRQILWTRWVQPIEPPDEGVA